MLYTFEITTSANTPSSAKEKTIARLERGVIKGFSLHFPPGCAGLVHCHINDALHQIWPTNPDMDIVGDTYLIKWDDEYILDQPPLQLEIYTYNEDTVYDHTIRVTFWLISLAGPPRLNVEWLEDRGIFE